MAERFPILLTVGSLEIYQYEPVGALELLGHCRFDVWRKGGETAISITDQCENCVGTLRTLVGAGGGRPVPHLEVVRAPDQPPARGPWILLVADEPRMLEALTAALQVDDFRVAGVASADDALARLGQEAHHLPCALVIDLVVTQTACWAFVHELDQAPTLAGIPRCVISGRPKPRFAIAASVLPPPIDLEKLLEVVHRACRTQGDEELQVS